MNKDLNQEQFNQYVSWKLKELAKGNIITQLPTFQGWLKLQKNLTNVTNKPKVKKRKKK